MRFTTISTFTMTMSEDDLMFNAIDEEDKIVPIIMTDNTRNKISVGHFSLLRIHYEQNMFSLDRGEKTCEYPIFFVSLGGLRLDL